MAEKKERCPTCGRLLPADGGITPGQIKVLYIVRKYERTTSKLTGDILALEVGCKSRGDAIRRLRNCRDRGWVVGENSYPYLNASGAARLKDYDG